MSPRLRNILIACGGLFLFAVAVYQIPYVQSVLDWRIEKFFIYVRNVVDPVGPVPTALPVSPSPVIPTGTPAFTATPNMTPTVEPTPTPTIAPLPPSAVIKSPKFERQTPNNCGPATLSMALHMYGWEGTQADIASDIKPVL
ncbi:MAG: hypothetical protein FJZ87_12685, partial [Chloroflexi bacterium]|nr:hypothetical protein [Chloroflexota bacterium]